MALQLQTQCSQSPSLVHRNTREALSKENLWGSVCLGLSGTGAQGEVCVHPAGCPALSLHPTQSAPMMVLSLLKRLTCLQPELMGQGFPS